MIPQEEWLPQAQRLAVGMRLRVRHGHERTAAMTVANEGDRWWAYCQRCKDGAVLTKEHALLSAPPAESARLDIPTDGILPDWTGEHEALTRFLLRKGMLPQFLPEDTRYSPSRKRLLVPNQMGTMGRDVTDKAVKWLTYEGQTHLIVRAPADIRRGTVLVEDPFSMYKVQYAVDNVDVICTLGTRPHDSVILQVLQTGLPVVVFYDGDPAGHRGMHAGIRRFRSMGVPATGLVAPLGLDPKDLHLQDISDYVQEAFRDI